MTATIRIKPPHVEMTAELVWVLLRAFGPIDSDVPAGSHDKRLSAAEDLHLATRIAARHRPETLASELSQRSIEVLQRALRGQVAQGLAILEMERLCCVIGSENEVSCVLLKFAALRRYGIVNVSQRAAVDLDLLVNEGDIGLWTERLAQTGAVREAHWVPRYHPSVVRSPSGVNVEFHVRLPYLCTTPHSRSVNLGELEEALLLIPAGPENLQVLLPRKDLLVAHLIVHGLVQHAYAPAAYPAFRLLADMVDIGLGQDEALAVDSTRWLGENLGPEDVEGLRQLTRHAAQGTVMSLVGSGSTAELLLNHLLASATDDRYRRWLRIRRLGQVLTESGPVETILHLGRAISRDMRSRGGKR